MTFNDLINHPILWLGILIIALPALVIILPIIITLIVARHDDPENFNLKTIIDTNFPTVPKCFDKIKSKRMLSVSDKLSNEYPAVKAFVEQGYKVTKFETAIVIDEHRQKWICINNADMPVLDFSEIIDTELISKEKYFFILIHTTNISCPKIRIDAYDRAAADRLLNTVKNMCISAGNQK